MPAKRGLDQAYGRLGWSHTIERCTSSVWSVQETSGVRYAAFAAATVSVSVGPPGSPLAVRQAVGHAESTPQATAGQATALAEEGAVASALERCAAGLLDDPRPHTAVTPAPTLPQREGEALALLAGVAEEEPVAAELMNQLWRTARHLHGRDGARALWAELDLSPHHPPQGRHARRLLDLLDFDRALIRGAA